MVQLLKNLAISVGAPCSKEQDENIGKMEEKIEEVGISCEGGEEFVRKNIINQIIDNVAREDYKNDRNDVIEKSAASTVATEDDNEEKIITEADVDNNKIATAADEDNDITKKSSTGKNGKSDISKIKTPTPVRFSARLAAKNSMVVTSVQMQEDDSPEDVVLHEFSWIFSEEDSDDNKEVVEDDAGSVIEDRNKNEVVIEGCIPGLRRSTRIGENMSKQHIKKRVGVFKEEQQEKKARIDKKIGNRKPWNYGFRQRKRL